MTKSFYPIIASLMANEMLDSVDYIPASFDKRPNPNNKSKKKRRAQKKKLRQQTKKSRGK